MNDEEVTVTSKYRRTSVETCPGVGIVMLVGIILIVLPAMAHAQTAREKLLSVLRTPVGHQFDGRADAGTRTFGTNSVSHTVGGSAFTGWEMTFPDLWETNDSGSRFCATPPGFPCILIAPLRLPAGALITSIELNACDTNPALDASVVLRQAPSNEAPPIVLATVMSNGFQPFCRFYTTVLPFFHTVDNVNNTYTLTYTGAEDISTRVVAVRIFYNLQVSPSPAVASFNDVPTTHPFFRWIEALLSAGITGGCGGGNYCPDDPVTRGQMAVFLSRALGLNFVP